jgi:hypothetical protein
MPAKDIFHLLVKHALEKEGWRITHEQYHLKVDDRDLYIDLAAERMLAAEKDGVYIAVEVKSFVNSSPMSEFHLAIGQFINYRLALHEHDPQRHLFLAIPLDTYETLFALPFVQRVIQTNNVSLCVYSIQQEEMTTWINVPPIENISNNS